jgi:hypothetical protein
MRQGFVGRGYIWIVNTLLLFLFIPFATGGVKQMQQSLLWFEGSLHTIGMAKGIAILS